MAADDEDTTKKAGQPTKILGDAAPDKWWDEIKMLRERVAALEADGGALRTHLRHHVCPWDYDLRRAQCNGCEHESLCKRTE